MKATSWALLAGNFAIGCGVMVAPGSLNDITRDLQVSVAVGGQLITVASMVMALGAPLLAAVAAGWDRRRLLAFALVWYALGHLLSAAMPSFAALTPVRALTMLGAAAFTPAAAAAMGALAPPEARGRAITFIFLGWSVASVFGMPLGAYVGETFGWRCAFVLVALMALAAAAGVWRTMPDGVRPPPLSLAAWREVFTRPALFLLVIVTAMSSSGQFALFTYLAPYYRQVLNADAAGISALFFWFGLCGLASNLMLSRHIDRVGAARAVTWLLASVALSLLLWPLAGSVGVMALVTIPWALGCFASNSAQQARMAQAAPALAGALIALNTSAMYLGQAVGAAAGGAIVAANLDAGRPTYEALNWLGLGWMLCAVGLSFWATRRHRAESVGNKSDA